MPLGELLNGLRNRSAGEDTAPVAEFDRVRLLDTYERSGEGWFWASDRDGNLTYLTETVCRLIGDEQDALYGRPLTDIFVVDEEVLDEQDGKNRPLNFILKARNSVADLLVKAPVEGRDIWWSITGRPLFDAEGQFEGYGGHGKDVTIQRQERRDAARLAEYDTLTGMANRNRMGRRLHAILSTYRAAKRSCALIMVGLDRFKHINDTLGHAGGDELLKQVSLRLDTIIAKRGEIGRVGGDEFQVILPDFDDRGKLGEIAARIIQLLSQPYTVDGTRCTVGASVGVAIAPYDGLEADQLVRSADLALYEAKRGGRGQYRFYSSSLKDEAVERRVVEDDLRDALANNQMRMQYQPIVRIADNMVVGFESLMRWEHPVKGRISPAVFIPIAEDSHLINALGGWALRTACSDAASWAKPLQFSVNVSAVQFAMEGFAAMVASVLAATQIDPKRLVLEITESVFLGGSEANERIFRALLDLGVKLSLDDFGTGYSSLSYLSTSPFEKLKIDRSFVERSTERGNKNKAIITATIGLANALKMEVIVEGVEAFDQLDLIRAMGGKLVQGWIYSPALSQSEVLEQLASGDFRIEPNGPRRHRPTRRAMYRKIGVIHGDFRYDVVLRDLSRTGARIEGLLGVPVNTQFVLDLGNGQLVLARVVRCVEAVQGVEFDEPLISDGAGGLCTRHRLSPYVLAAAGMPLAALPPGHYAPKQAEPHETPKSTMRFMQVALPKQPREQGS